VTPNTGTYVVRSVTAALSVVVSSGSTLGTLSATAARVYFGFIDNAGTVELCVWNPVTTTGLAGFSESALQSTTAEGGAGAADSAGVLYSTTARSSLAFRIGGYLECTETTAGTWAQAPTILQNMGPGIRRTGDVVQTRYTQTGAFASGTTAIPNDDTIPQNTEGDQYMTLSLTPSSTINILEHKLNAQLTNSNATARIGMAIFQDSTANALAAAINIADAGHSERQLYLHYQMPAGTVSSTTFNMRGGGGVGATTYFNGSSGARKYGGALNSSWTITEIFV
jgi:hypothetical protein